MKCRFEFFPVYSSTGMYGGGHALAGCRCATHQFDMGQMFISADTLCPVGAVEKARDEAIEAIRAERNPEK